MFRELSFLFIFRGVGTRLGEILPSHVILEEVFLGGNGSQESPDFQSAFSAPSSVDSSHHPGAWNGVGAHRQQTWQGCQAPKGRPWICM